MEKEVFLDVETQNLFHEVEGRNPRALKISFLGVYVRPPGEFQGYFEKELGRLWSVLRSADRIIGYNIRRFDFVVMAPYFPGDITKLPVFDLMEAVEKDIGFKPKLDDIARATLGLGKTGSGIDAVRLFRAGKLDELKKYCLNDVKVTAAIYDKAMKEGKLKYFDRQERPHEFDVSWADPAKLPRRQIEAQDESQMSLI